MDLRDLQYFEVIARLEHLGRDKRLGEAPAALAALHQELTALRQAFGLAEA